MELLLTNYVIEEHRIRNEIDSWRFAFDCSFPYPHFPPFGRNICWLFTGAALPFDQLIVLRNGQVSAEHVVQHYRHWSPFP